jgi:hypothetical protein
MEVGGGLWRNGDPEIEILEPNAANWDPSSCNCNLHKCMSSRTSTFQYVKLDHFMRKPWIDLSSVDGDLRH